MRRDGTVQADGPGRASAMKNWRYIALHTVAAAAFIFLLQRYVLHASLESSLLCQTEAGQIAFINALPKSFAQVILQHSEFHSWEYSMGYSNSLINKRFPQPLWYNNLDHDCAFDAAALRRSK